MTNSPIAYMGNKKRLIKKGLIDLFPSDIKTFYDVFSGSGIVSMNVDAEKYVLNDINLKVIDLYKIFATTNSNKIIQGILENITQFDLTRKGVKQNTPEADIYKPRYIKMREHCNSSLEVIDMYTCTFYAFSRQMRFNKKGGFNMPFGNGAFTKIDEENIYNGVNFFNKDVSFYGTDFLDLDYSAISKNDFIYLDPPYSNSTATYNEKRGVFSWGENDDLRLFKFCEELTSKGIKWGMSNALICKDKENTALIDWCDKNNLTVFNFEKMKYVACGKGDSKVKEVYICNY